MPSFFLLAGTVEVTGVTSPVGCITSPVGIIVLIGSIFIFFRREYHIHCLPKLQYVWWVLGATIADIILLVTVLGSTNASTSPIVSAIGTCVIALYGISLMWIAHLKPSLAQQVNESVSHILKRMPRREIAASELFARLQKKYTREKVALQQCIENLEYIELVTIPGAPGLLCRMRQQKPAVAVAPLALPPVNRSGSQFPPMSLSPQIAVKPVGTPQPSYPLNRKPEERSLADRETIPALPVAMPNHIPLSSPSHQVALPNMQPGDAVPPPSIQHIPPSRPKPKDGSVSFMQPVTPSPPKPRDPVLLPPSQVVPPAPSVSPSPKPSPSSAKEQKAIQIFCCYAHEDERLLEKLKTHLQPQQRQGLIQVWHDRDISAGAEWEQEIEQQLNSAQVILLLVSPHFIASDYCYNKEMHHVLARHARGEIRAIPIILRPTDWKITPLGKLQALPKDGKPITTWSNSDIAYLDVATGIRTIVETFFTPLQQPQKQIQHQNNMQHQKADAEAELIRTRCTQGKLVVTNKKIAIELPAFGKVIKSQILLRSSLTSIESKVAVFPVLGMGGGMNLTFHGKGRETLKAELVPFKEAQEVLALLS